MAGPHDRYVKKILSNPKHAAAELRAVLPKEVARRIDWSTLKLESATFIDEALQDRYGDLVFSASIDGTRGFIYVLFEHQSTLDALIPYRFLRSMVGLWDAIVEADPHLKKLPPILPVLLEQPKSEGEDGQAVVRCFEAIIDVEPSFLKLLRPYVPSFEVLVDAIGSLAVQDLKARKLPPQVEMMVFLLQRGRLSPALLAELADWAGELETLSRDPLGLGPVVSYILEVRQEPLDEIKEFFQQRLGSIGEEALMTAAQQLAEQVRKEALSQGRAEGRAEGQVGLLLKLLQVRFGSVSEATAEKVRRATQQQLERWAERVLTAASIDDVLDDG